MMKQSRCSCIAWVGDVWLKQSGLLRGLRLPCYRSGTLPEPLPGSQYENLLEGGRRTASDPLMSFGKVAGRRGKSAACRLSTLLDSLGPCLDEVRLVGGSTSWRREGLVGRVSSAVLALAEDAVMLADAAVQALLASDPDAVMLAYLRSPAFLALALHARVGAYARPQELLALAPDAGRSW